MHMKLLQWLHCPKCKESVTIQSFVDKGSQVIQGVLVCHCGEWFPVIDGIPHMLIGGLRYDYTSFIAKYKQSLPLQRSPSTPTTLLERGNREQAVTQDSGASSFDGRKKKCLLCNCTLAISSKAEICRGCTKKLLHRGLNTRLLVDLYDRFENEGNPGSNTNTNYTCSDLFPNWLAEYESLGSSIVEIGCGGGYLSEEIRRKGFANLFSSDINARTVEIATNRFPGLHGVIMDARCMAFASSSLDCVISVEMVEHLLDPEEHFREVNRVLRPGGKYLLRTPNFLASTVYYWWSGRYDMAVWHPSTFSCRSLRRMLDESGFTLEHLSPTSLTKSQVNKLPLFLKFLQKVPLRWVPLSLRPSIIVVAEKKIIS